MAERLAGFLQIFTDSAGVYSHAFLIDLTSDILGYKAPDPALDQSYGRLREGQMLGGRDRNGRRRVFQYQFYEYEHVRPMKNLAFPIALTKVLWDAQRSDAEWIKIIVPESIRQEYEAVLHAWKQHRPERYQDLFLVWTSAALLVAGEENASVLLEAWMETEEAMQRLKDMHYDNVVMMPLISQRRVLICLIRTLMHAVKYQEILDRTDSEEQPLLQTVWPVSGDERLLEMNEICRAEIDNTYELYGYIAKAPGAFLALAESEKGEDIFLLGQQLPGQLLKKAEIMLAHMRDGEQRYESTNR